MMKRLHILHFSLLIVATLFLQSFMVGDDTLTKEDGMIVINTTELGKDIEGYNGPTPLKVYINKNKKVERIEFLKSMETPKYYVKVKKALQDKWNGLKIKEAKTLQVDAVTGATFSSEAVIQNVQLALDYYQNHK
jgi:Na+-translocating ferredoxin:NAD+ oxidoreductase RnfG subunit